MSGNQALITNAGIGGTADLTITDHGSDVYFAVCAIMTVSSLAFMGMAMTKPRSHRLFHYITASITFVAAIAYFTMGSGLGQTPVQVEFQRFGSNQGLDAAGTRSFFYVRYIDWFITTPLLLLDLLLTAGVPFPSIAITILADEIMIVTGLVGALIPSSYKWGFWLFGMLAFFFVVYQLVVVGRSHARALGPGPSKTYNTCGILTLGIWFLYPIAWGLCEGGNVIHPDGEATFYSVCDVIAKPLFGILLLLGHRNISPAELGLKIHDPEATGLHHEKVTTQTTTGRRSNGFFGRKHAAGTDGHVADGANTTSVPATTTV